jgi:hypothetical protein
MAFKKNTREVRPGMWVSIVSLFPSKDKIVAFFGMLVLLCFLFSALVTALPLFFAPASKMDIITEFIKKTWVGFSLIIGVASNVISFRIGQLHPLNNEFRIIDKTMSCEDTTGALVEGERNSECPLNKR